MNSENIFTCLDEIHKSVLIIEMSNSCEEKVRVPGIINMESSEEGDNKDGDNLDSDKVKNLRLNIPLKIAVDNTMDSSTILSQALLKHKPAWVSPSPKLNSR